MRKSAFVSILAISVLSACATPGIEYEARLMATSADAAATRTVQVDRFRGPAGGWYAQKFEAMLANTVFDGQPWFTLAEFEYGVPGAHHAGTYTGYVDIADYTVDEYLNSTSKCIEWDGIFDCETRIDIEEACITESVFVQVQPKLIDADTGEVVFSGTYNGDASHKVCHEIAREGKDGKMRPSKRHGQRLGVAGFGPPSHLVREALAETLRPIRIDIAPRNAVVKAVFISEPLMSTVAADLRFKQALEVSNSDPEASCALWSAMAVDHENSPAVTHNLGACAEASSDFELAHKLYAEAADYSAKYSDDGVSAGKLFLSSLRRLSDQRFGVELIEEVKQPVFAASSES